MTDETLHDIIQALEEVANHYGCSDTNEGDLISDAFYLLARALARKRQK